MSTTFATLAYTPAVQARQTRHGSRHAYAAQARHADEGPLLGAAEAAFIQARDSFYQASVGETGWPYVQHRGGPAGFLQVIDDHTLAYADLRGNRQYVSVGNLDGNDRVALILMDYPNQRRLKVLGHARLVEAADDPALMQRLAPPGGSTRIERAVLISVAALDWNCPQHIMPRFTEAEVREAVAPLHAEIARLREALTAAPDSSAGAPPRGR